MMIHPACPERMPGRSPVESGGVAPAVPDDHHELTMTPSMGIALFPQDGTDFGHADPVGRRGHVPAPGLDGRNTFRFFTPGDAGPVGARLAARNARAAPWNGSSSTALPAAWTWPLGTVRSVEALFAVFRQPRPHLLEIHPDC